MNLAHKFAIAIHGSVKAARKKYEGACIDFAGEFGSWWPTSRMAYFDNIDHPVWKYHCAVEIDGEIHCLWHPMPVRLKGFMILMGAKTVEYPAEDEQRAKA